MASGYTRQSTLEIIDGEVIFASDFNNEFDALLAAFSGTTGHDHSGGLGQGPVISFSNTSGSIPPIRHGIQSTTTDPTVNDDVDTYINGNTWLNTATEGYFVLVDKTDGAAKWRQLTVGRVRSTTTIPGLSDDNAQFYQVGSHWYNSTQGQWYIAKSVGTGAASWSPLMVGRNVATNSNPGVNDDNTAGFTVGSHWFNTATQSLAISTSVATGAAAWAILGDEGQAALFADVMS